MEKCAYERWRVFYLGGKPGIAHTAAHQLRFKYPELQLKTFHGYFNKANQENANVIDMITQFKPNILMVGMGMPLQDVLIILLMQFHHHRDGLDVLDWSGYSAWRASQRGFGDVT